jgi:hypothetical protein
LRPVLVYRSKAWTVTKNDEECLRIFETKLLRKIFGLKYEKGTWRMLYNYEIGQLFSEPAVGTSLKILKLRRARHVVRKEEDNPVKKLTFQKPFGSRRKGLEKL